MNARNKGLVLTSLGVGIMSFEAPLIQLSGLSSASFGFYFGLFIFLSTNLFLLFRGLDKFKLAYKSDKIALFLGAIFMGLGNLCFILAVKHTGIAITVLILATSPILSALAAFVFIKEKTPTYIFKSSFFVFIGLVIIIFDELELSSYLGILYAFGCVSFTTCMIVVMRKYQNANRGAYVGLAGLVIMVESFFGANLHIDFSSLLVVFLTGFIVTPLSRVLIGFGTRYLVPAEISLLYIGESILAPIWGIIILSEFPSTQTFIGGFIILLALVFNALKK